MATSLKKGQSGGVADHDAAGDVLHNLDTDEALARTLPLRRTSSGTEVPTVAPKGRALGCWATLAVGALAACGSTTHGYSPIGTQRTVPQTSSVVTGFIEPCLGFGKLVPTVPTAAGTVTVYRLPSAVSTEPSPRPSDVVAREHVKKKEPYRFSLAPGNYYTLSAAFDERRLRRPPLVTFKAMPGVTLHLNTGNTCHRSGD